MTSTLSQYPFQFRGARILSGEDEGVFGWVTANYLLENFIKVVGGGVSCLSWAAACLAGGCGRQEARCRLGGRDGAVSAPKGLPFTCSRIQKSERLLYNKLYSLTNYKLLSIVYHSIMTNYNLNDAVCPRQIMMVDSQNLN